MDQAFLAALQPHCVMGRGGCNLVQPNKVDVACHFGKISASECETYRAAGIAQAAMILHFVLETMLFVGSEGRAEPLGEDAQVSGEELVAERAAVVEVEAEAAVIAAEAESAAASVERSWIRPTGALGNYGMGSGTRAEADRLGKEWVGPGYRVSKSNSNILLSADGLRQYRAPSFKSSLGLTQANFEERDQPTARWTSNGHFEVTDP